MSIEVGHRLPNVNLYEGESSEKVNLRNFTQNKRVIVFGIPGAFSPGCSKTHLPGFVARSEEFKKNGFSDVFCITVNDVYVCAAWGREHHVEGKVRILADPAGDFTRAIGMLQYIEEFHCPRSMRYSMIIANGVVKALNVERQPMEVTCSLANRIKI